MASRNAAKVTSQQTIQLRQQPHTARIQIGSLWQYMVHKQQEMKLRLTQAPKRWEIGRKVGHTQNYKNWRAKSGKDKSQEISELWEASFRTVFIIIQLPLLLVLAWDSQESLNGPAHQDHRECEKRPFGKDKVGYGSQEKRVEEVLYKTTEERDPPQGSWMTIRGRDLWKAEKAVRKDALRQRSFTAPSQPQWSMRIECSYEGSCSETLSDHHQIGQLICRRTAAPFLLGWVSELMALI